MRNTKSQIKVSCMNQVKDTLDKQLDLDFDSFDEMQLILKKLLKEIFKGILFEA